MLMVNVFHEMPFLQITVTILQQLQRYSSNNAFEVVSGLLL